MSNVLIRFLEPNFQVMPRQTRTAIKCEEAKVAHLARKNRHPGSTPSRQTSKRVASKRADSKILLDAIRMNDNEEVDDADEEEGTMLDMLI